MEIMVAVYWQPSGGQTRTSPVHGDLTGSGKSKNPIVWLLWFFSGGFELILPKKGFEACCNLENITERWENMGNNSNSRRVLFSLHPAILPGSETRPSSF